jgi:hypothetical protein
MYPQILQGRGDLQRIATPGVTETCLEVGSSAAYPTDTVQQFLDGGSRASLPTARCMPRQFGCDGAPPSGTDGRAGRLIAALARVVECLCK